MKIFAPLLLVVFIIGGCGEKKKSAKDQLYDKVMAVHDEIMPKMDDISKYKKQLTQKIKELSATDEEANAVKIGELKEAVEALENSHEDMMGWMHQFNRNFDDMVEQEIMEYLDGQKEKIETVGKATNLALKNAEELLAN